MALGTPTSYWKLDEASGDAADSVAGANTLTNRGTTAYASSATAGSLNNCADFGTALSSGKALYKDSVLGWTGGVASISIWIKLRTEITSGLYKFVGLTNASNHLEFVIYYDYNGGTRRVAFDRVRLGTANERVLSNVTLGTLTWNHFVITYDGTNVKGYLNGSLLGTQAASGNGSSAGTDRFSIGAGYDFANEAPCYADEVIYYSGYALTLPEIVYLYNLGTPLAYPFTITLGRAETITLSEIASYTKQIAITIIETLRLRDVFIKASGWTNRAKNALGTWTNRSKN